MKAFVAIAIIAFFCASFGFFVSQTLSASSDLVALSDEEMMQRNGGKWTDYLYRMSSGDFANCPTPSEENPCPDTSTHRYNHPLYKCDPCWQHPSTVYAWTQKTGCAKETSSKCSIYQNPTMYCDYENWVSDTYTGCWTPDGICD